MSKIKDFAWFAVKVWAAGVAFTFVVNLIPGDMGQKVREFAADPLRALRG